MSKATRKPGSGRKKGSVSFVEVTVSELNRLFKPDYLVPVSRKWAEQNKINGRLITASSIATLNEDSIEIKEHNFNTSG